MHFFKIISYIAVIIVIYSIVKRDYVRNQYCAGISSNRITIKSMIVISVIIGLYSISYNHTFWWADVTYYNKLFSNGLAIPESQGLNLIFTILHFFTNNIDCLLFVVASLATLVMLAAYNCFEEAYPSCILLLLVTPFFIETCQVNLKQSIACGLVSLSIAFALKRKNICALIACIAATFFHITAAPICIMTIIAIMLYKKTSIIQKLIFLLACVILLTNMNYIFELLNYFFGFIPGFSEKLSEYYSAEGVLVNDSTGVIFFKGVPYYLITALGFLFRKDLNFTEDNYDEYLLISLFASISYMLSAQSYWMSRIINYYWLADFAFFSILLERMSISNRKVSFYTIFAMLFILTFRELFQIYPI